MVLQLTYVLSRISKEYIYYKIKDILILLYIYICMTTIHTVLICH